MSNSYLASLNFAFVLESSKRTLQRYRSSGELPFQMIYHKTYYKESDVIRFIEKHFSSFRNMNKKNG
ncbi:DNA-binding protein [Dysgonomonas sp. 521]|nr:DNA-binding protein [Dysgonomonas sp. 521]